MTSSVPPSPALSPTPRSTVRRHRDRQRDDARELDAILDEARVCHVGHVVDGAPVVLPNLHVRVGDTLYLHGSSGAAGLQGDEALCVTVTLLDGLVHARRWFAHSANYRSAVVRGHARRVVDPEERLTALRALVDHLVGAGRAEATEPPTRQELAATAVVAVALDEASVKVRSGPPGDGAAAVAAGDLRWAGEVPVHTVLGTPRACPALPTDVVVPEHVRRLVSGPGEQQG